VVYTEGGEAIEPGRALSISQQIGASGGFTHDNNVRAAFDGYNLALGNFGAASPPNGKLVSAIFMNEFSSIDQDYLYRRKIPGRPELNQMTTELNMGGHNIQWVGNLDADHVQANNVNVDGHIKAQTIETNSLNAAAEISAVDLHVGQDARIDGTTYTGKMQASGNIQAGENIEGRVLSPTLVAQKNASCQGQLAGSIARTNQGSLLSCQSGVWLPAAQSGGLCRDGRIVRFALGVTVKNTSDCEWILFVRTASARDTYVYVYFNGHPLLDTGNPRYSLHDSYTVPVPIGATIAVTYSGGYAPSVAMYRN